MSKAKAKVSKAVKKVESPESIKSPMKGTDLSVQKRIELFNKEYTAFMTQMRENYGLGIDVEIVFNKKAIVPRQVLVDLLAQPTNENQEAAQA